MKKIILIAFISLSFISQAQIEQGGFVNVGRGASAALAQDYQSLGINPSNLGWTREVSEKRIHIGSTEFRASVQSDFFKRSELASNFSSFSIADASREEITILAQEFASSPFRLNSNAMIFGAALTTEKLGGIALKVNNKTSFNATMGDTFSDLIFNGSTSSVFENLVLADGTEVLNSDDLSEETLSQVVSGYTDILSALSLTEILDGTNIALSNTTEFQLGYGRRFLDTEKFDVYLGASGKYILGHNLVQLNAEGDEINVLAAFSPALNLSFGDVTSLNPTALGQQAKSYTPVGSGYGLDFGATIIGTKLKLSAAVNDIGKITWKSNLYTFEDDLLQELALNSLSEGEVVPQISDLLTGDGQIGEWQSAVEESTDLPTKLRLGGAFSITPKINFGIDVIQPLDDSPFKMDGARIAVGADIRVLKKFILNSGVVMDEIGQRNIPLGIVLEAGAYQCGIASSDLFTYFSEDSPNISIAFGFLRFRI